MDYLLIFYHFFSSLLYEEKFSQSDSKAADDGITRAISLMQERLHTVSTLKDFADSAGLSVSHFSAVFKESTVSRMFSRLMEVSPVEYRKRNPGQR